VKDIFSLHGASAVGQYDGVRIGEDEDLARGCTSYAINGADAGIPAVQFQLSTFHFAPSPFVDLSGHRDGLCFPPFPRCSQRHAEFRCLLIRGSYASLQLASD
jgi:hypothetical protein